MKPITLNDIMLKKVKISPWAEYVAWDQDEQTWEEYENKPTFRYMEEIKDDPSCCGYFWNNENENGYFKSNLLGQGTWKGRKDGFDSLHYVGHLHES